MNTFLVSGNRILKRKSFGLACRRMKGSHTYSEIAHVMEAVLREYGIQSKTTSAVTDSGSNFTKAIRLFEERPAEMRKLKRRL